MGIDADAWYPLKGYVGAAGKATVLWGELKAAQ